mgnify:FL=1
MVDPVVEQRRQEYLEWLYQRAGRNDQLYTGLFQQRQQELLEIDIATMAPSTPLSERVGAAAIHEVAAWLRQQGLDLSAQALIHEA